MTPFPTPPPLTRTWLLGLSAVTLLALGVRLPVIGAHSFWYDEAVTQQLIRKPTHDILNGSARDNGNPPLYLLAARGWQQAVGPGDDGLRGFSLLCSVATVAALGALGRRLGGPAVGLAAAAVYAASPLSVEFAHEARTYALLHLLAVVNVWWFVLALAHDRPWDWAGYAATMFLAWYSHYYAAFLPLSHVLVLAVLPWRSRRWLAWAAATGAASVAWATWLPTFLSQLSTPGNLSRSAENWPVQFLATPISFALGRSFAWRESPAWWLGVAAAGTLAAFVVPAALGAVRLRRHRAAAVLLLGWLLLPVAVPLAFAALGRPVYSHRYAAIGLPAFAVLVAAGYVNLRPTPRVALGVLAAALTAVSLYRYGTEPLKDDWRSAAPTILRGLDPGRLLVFDTAIEVVSFQHYAGAGEPREAVGLDSAPADGPALIGVRYRDGVRVDPVARDLAPDVFARDRICLVLCVPGRPEACHLALFRERGFELRRAAEYHRIRVLFLDREAGPPAPTPRGMP